MAVTQDERQVLGLEGRDLVDNVVCQLDTQPLPLEMQEQGDRRAPHQTLPDKVDGAEMEPRHGPASCPRLR